MIDGTIRSHRGRIVVDYSIPPVIEWVDEQPLPLRWQLFAAFMACSCTAAIGFIWAYLIFGVAQ
jgi:hypothetical protein